MSELSAKIEGLKGELTTQEVISLAKVSRETFRKIERGESVKLSTLRAIARALKASESAWLDLLVAWLKKEAGDEKNKIWIEPREKDFATVHDDVTSQSARALMLFGDLNAAERAEIIKAMERPEVRGCLPAINRVWEKFATPHPATRAAAGKIASVAVHNKG